MTEVDSVILSLLTFRKHANQVWILGREEGSAEPLAWIVDAKNYNGLGKNYIYGCHFIP